MLVIKIVVYSFIFLSCSGIGILISKKYSDRERELKEIKTALNIFKTKIKFTYEPIPEIFQEISLSIDSNIGHIFKIARKNMQNEAIQTAWEKSLDIRVLNLNKEDLEVLKKFGKLLGKTDIQGQINQIELTENFIDMQIEKAYKDRNKNERMYRTLGMISGIAIVIILM